MQSKTITRGFILAGFSNIIGVLVFSKFLTNQTLMNTQPEVMGFFGLISIIIWGFAYIAVSKNYAGLPWLIAVFVLEKLVYVIAYILWFSTHSLSAVYETDIFAGIFYTIYGINDFLFGVFFTMVFLQLKFQQKTSKNL